MIKDLLGLGRVFGHLAEVFVPNKTKGQEQDHEQMLGSQAQYAAEFQYQRLGPFDQFVDGLNRLPRPALALGTVGLFVYAMWNPAEFSIRMIGLSQVPDPLWWLLGAIVSFYFGARELHHFRVLPRKITKPQNFSAPLSAKIVSNQALEDWRILRGEKT